jgi:hypothetical protein
MQGRDTIIDSMPRKKKELGVIRALMLAGLTAAAGATDLSTADLRALAGTRGFKPYSGHPVLAPGPRGAWDAGALGSMTVLKAKDVFHMYYEAWGVRSAKEWSQEEYNSLQIGHATSTDGVHWVKDPANPVLPKGTGAAAWDRDGTWDPFVIYEDGLFKMWYGGGNKVCDWGYAVSKDGTHFTKKARLSRLGRVEDDHVIHDRTAGTYDMYFWNRAFEPMGLFRARAATETGFDFGKAEALRIEGEQYPGMYKFTHVFTDGGAWYMLYGDFVRPHCPDSTVRLAASPDGLTWTSVNRNLVEGHDGEILQAAAGLYLLYYGPRNHFDAAGCDIRVALYAGELRHLAGRDKPAEADRPQR